MISGILRWVLGGVLVIGISAIYGGLFMFGPPPPDAPDAILTDLGIGPPLVAFSVFLAVLLLAFGLKLSGRPSRRSLVYSAVAGIVLPLPFFVLQGPGFPAGTSLKQWIVILVIMAVMSAIIQLVIWALPPRTRQA